MSAFTTFLPGVRELRTPMAVGALWIACAVTVSYPYRDTLLELPFAIRIQAIVEPIPASISVAALAFSAYMVGILASGLAASVAQWPFMAELPARAERSAHDSIRWLALKVIRPNETVSGLVRNTIREKLRSTSEILPDIVPVQLAMSEFHLAGLRLSKDAPEQYQQYDRTRAEAEFRTGVALPLWALGLTLAATLPWFAAIVAIIVLSAAFAMLALQGVAHHHRADELLASAIYFGYTATPLLDILIESAQKQLPGHRDDPEAFDIAWLADFLSERGLIGHYFEVLSKLRHPSRGGGDVVARALPLMSEKTKVQLSYHLRGHGTRPPGMAGGTEGRN